MGEDVEREQQKKSIVRNTFTCEQVEQKLRCQEDLRRENKPIEPSERCESEVIPRDASYLWIDLVCQTRKLRDHA